MNILVTGGVGFIGSHLSENLIADGDNVICLDNFFNSTISNVKHLLNKKNFRLVKGDILDKELMNELISESDAVVHLAAQIHVDRSVIEPVLTYNVNVLGTLNILELVRKYDVRKVIFASSSEVYGSAVYVPMDEKHPMNPPHPYGASKVAADRLCYAYNQTYGMKINIVRPFNIFGPRQSDSSYGGVIAIFTRRIFDNQAPLIYGTGQQTRDYTYVKDAVEFYKRVLDSKENFSDPINFGTGREIKILELANMLIELCGKKNKLKPEFVKPRTCEVMRLYADNARAKELFGFTPQYSFEEGLKEYIKWYIAQNNNVNKTN